MTRSQRVVFENTSGIFFSFLFSFDFEWLRNLTSESVESTSLSLESVDDVKSSDSLSSGVLGVGDGISDDVLKEDLKDTTGLFVDKTRDTLDATSSCQSSDGRLGDALDVISQDLSVTLGTTLS